MIFITQNARVTSGTLLSQSDLDGVGGLVMGIPAGMGRLDQGRMKFGVG
jgi:hypothetical protein